MMTTDDIDTTLLETADTEAPDPVRLAPFADGLGANAPAILSERSAAFLPVALDDIRAVAAMLSKFPGIKDEFRKPEACEAITLQAALWRVSPLFVLQCAYQAKAGGPIGYEAKLIHAVILANGPLSRRPRLRYGYKDPTNPKAGDLFCVATFWIIGEEEPIHVQSPTVSQIKVKNSPEWFSNPRQQIGYYILRAGARLHFPDVLGGAYTREEVVYMRASEAAPRLNHFPDEDAQDAEFEGHAPTAQEDTAFERWERKASGEASKDDPREDVPPPQGEDEPKDAAEVRAWAAAEQKRMLALGSDAALKAEWLKFLADKRTGRLKSYQQPIFNAIRAAVIARGNQLATAEKAGADTTTGEV